MTIIYDNAWQTFKEQIITLSPLFVNVQTCMTVQCIISTYLIVDKEVIK